MLLSQIHQQFHVISEELPTRNTSNQFGFSNALMKWFLKLCNNDFSDVVNTILPWIYVKTRDIETRNCIENQMIHI